MENTPGLTTPSSLLWATWSFSGPSLSAVFLPLCTDLLGSLLTSLNVASIWPGHFSHHRSVSQLLPLTLSSFCASYLWKTPSRSTIILILFCFQFSSVAQSCPTLCDPMNCSMPGLPVHHQLPVCSVLSFACGPSVCVTLEATSCQTQPRALSQPRAASRPGPV